MISPFNISSIVRCGNATIQNEDQLWYYQTYLNEVYKVIEEGIPVIGYTAWSFVDNYEWGVSLDKN